MPPVFGPRSPSKARLWSWAVPRKRQSVPSVRTKSEASSPVMNSSMTTRAPGPSAKIASRAAWASAAVSATVTPLPAARPSALTTIGAPWASTQAWAASGSVKVWLAAVGAPQAAQISLAKALEASRRAASRPGPRVGDAGGAQGVGDALGERGLGAYHHEIDGVLGAEGQRSCRRRGCRGRRRSPPRRCRGCRGRTRGGRPSGSGRRPRRARARGRRRRGSGCSCAAPPLPGSPSREGGGGPQAAARGVGVRSRGKVGDCNG